MPRIVPLQLLRCLRVLLDNNGGILSTVEVRRIAGLMTKYSKKLVSKCVYVQILKSTKTELLGDFMSVGGWGLVCTWLSDAIRTMNWPLVQEILELLLLSPVDVNRLKINSAPILVKGLCKDGGNEGVRILAKRLVEQWLKIVTENPSLPSPNISSGGSAEPPSAGGAPRELSGQGTIEPVSNVEHSSSDSTDSGGGGVVTQNYTISSAERKRNIVITIKSVDKSASVAASAADSLYNHDDSSLLPSESSAETRGGVEDNISIECSEKSILDDSSTTITDSKSGDDANKKHKSTRDKSKRSDRSDKDRKSSSSHRSSSSHKSSSSSSSSSSKSSSSKSSSSSSSHRSSSDKYRDKDKARSSSSSSSKDKDRGSSSSSTKYKSSSSKSSSSSSSSTPSSSKDRSRDKDKDKSSPSTGPKKENEKDNKLMPPPPPSSSTTSAQSEKKKEGEGEAQKPKSIPILSRKASISIEIRRDTEKTATVKTYQSKFRSHGLTEEAPPPPSRKGLKKPTASAAAPPTIPSAPTLKRSSPPPSRGEGSPAEKKAKIDINNVSGHVERPGAAKLIAPKKIQTLVETNLFSDALTASIEPKKMVKRKKLNSAMSPTEKDAPLAPLKFYQDTLDESKGEDKSDDSTKENDESRAGSPGKDTDADDDDIPLRKVKEDIEQKVQKERAPGDAAADEESSHMDDIDDTPEEPKKPGPGCGPNGPPGILMLHRRKGPKKKLTWQPEEKLTQVRCFEVDRSERVNVTKQSFLEMKNMERYSERDALNIARRGFDDIMEPQMEWRPLIEVDNVPVHPNGNLSKQRIVQAEREATTLRALYFSPDMIPDSAAEAELEPHFSHDIPIIPIDDLTGNPDAVNDYSTSAWPEPKGYGAAPNVEMGFNDSMNNMMPGLNPNLMPGNPFQPFGNNFMPNTGNMPPNPNQQMPMNMQQQGPPPIWQNQMTGSPMMNNMNGPVGGGGPGMDMNMPPNFMGNQFGSPVGPFGAPPQGFNNMNFPPMMMNGPGPGHGPGPMSGPMMNGPMPNGMGGPGPMQNGGGPRNNNRKAGSGGNWRSGGNNFQDNSGGNWRSAGSGSNRGGGVGGGNTGICKQFMRGHCHMGKASPAQPRRSYAVCTQIFKSLRYRMCPY
ncbi:serine/threonine-protein phosphatase 1 regulatory subunit 10 isoform X1 [Drosophila albomicans]|uniref:Serine/threonine-protein phosphatase 1 regulatory subunit 10 isoform X1 n=1 Tax=Drosophila albomicans TaxID=7291 RepID=A0A9C6WC87_DROAB|nr:serine/threonine-protein phosphatase 1 regulatory subunit 10 isoform X1 [Drosophila albomicans]